jgi:8-oxo-dGTP pyrophosphatase MutT (NUDIX family)
MAGASKSARAAVVLAAGGIVWRETARGPEVAIVHRPQHRDWTLPKGKLDPGESWQEAALREVEEETGLHPELGEFAGASSYMTNRAPKVVLYWHMHVEVTDKFAPHDPDEIDALEWLSVTDALPRLSYDRDRKILTESIVLLASDEPDAAAEGPSFGERLRAALLRKR